MHDLCYKPKFSGRVCSRTNNNSLDLPAIPALRYVASRSDPPFPAIDENSREAVSHPEKVCITGVVNVIVPGDFPVAWMTGGGSSFVLTIKYCPVVHPPVAEVY